MKSFFDNSTTVLEGRYYIQPIKTSLMSYGIIFLSTLIFLISVFFEVEYYYYLITFGIIVLITALVKMEASFFFIPLVLANPVALSETGTNLIISEYVLLIIFGAFVLQYALVLNKKIIVSHELSFVSYILLISLCLSLLSATYITTGILQVIRFVEIVFVLLIVIINTCTTEISLRRLTLSIIIAGLIASLVGIWQFFSGDVFGETGRIFGFVGGGYGGVIAASLMFCVGVILYEQSIYYKAVAMIAIPFGGMALLLSQTRAWIGAFIVVSVLMIFYNNRKVLFRLFILALGIIAGGALLIWTNVFGLVKSEVIMSVIFSALRFGVKTGQYSTIDASLFLRFNAWIHSMELFFQNPLTGIGISNLRFADYLPLRLSIPKPGAGYVDNQYIQMFTETGIIGGLAWLFFIGKSIKIGIISLEKVRNKTLMSVAFGAYSGLLVFVVGSAFWVITPHHELFAMMVLYIGMLISIHRLD